jgi:hypothetical protein
MRAKKLLGASAVLGLLAFSAAVAGGACGGSVPSDLGQGGTTATTTGSTSATGTGGGNAGDAGPDGDCYPDPMTYVEIINACTNAQAVDVNPNLPLLLPDGGLPPLP